MAVATTKKEQAFLSLASQAAAEEQLNVLDQIDGPPAKKPAIYQESKLMLDIQNKRVGLYLKGRWHYVNLRDSEGALSIPALVDISDDTNLAVTSPITLTGDTVGLNQAAVDHGSIGGLGDDDHTQYALLAGRAGSQILIGGTASGEDLTLQSTSNATKGSIFLGAANNSAYDEVNDRLGIGTATPSNMLVVTGNVPNAYIASLNNTSSDGRGLQIVTSETAAGNHALNVGTSGLSNALVVDGNGRVGIGKSAPEKTFHVLGTDGAVAAFPTIGGKDFLVAENNGNINMTFVAGSSSASALKFSKDGASGNIGNINYSHSNDRMTFATVDGTERLSIDGAAGFGFGITAPTAYVHISPGSISTEIYTVAGTTSSAKGVNMSLTNTNTTSGARGFELSPTMQGSSGAAGIGINPQLDPASAATIMYGVLNLVTATSSTFNITTLQANRYQVRTNASYSGAVTTADGLFMASPSFSGSKPTTSNGLRIANQGVSGMTNAYGLHIEAQSGASGNNQNIRSLGASSENYFQGNVEIDGDFNHDGSNFGALGAAPAAQRSHVADPSGGATQDAEARTAINAILVTLETFGFHATS